MSKKSKNLWIGGMTLLLLGAATARAEGKAGDKPEARTPETGKFQGLLQWDGFGPIQVEVQTEAKAVSGQPVETSRQVWVNGQPVETQIPGLEGGQPPVKLGQYWLGVAVGRPNDVLREKLKVPEGQGLVVQNVVPESPAGKAGIKEGDVLLKAGEQPLRELRDLVEVVNETNETPLTIELLRDGQQQTLTVTPAKRPEPFAAAREGNPDWDKIMKWFGQFQAGESEPGQPRMQFRIFRPGAILPPGALLQHPLPDDMTVTIAKTGKNPAQIKVQQGDKNWTVTPETLDKLPEGVRSHVEQLLGRLPFNVRIVEPGETPAPPQAPQWRERAVPPPAESRLEKRLEEMNQRIEKLNQTIEELRQQRKENRPPRKPAPEEKEEGKEGPKAF